MVKVSEYRLGNWLANSDAPTAHHKINPEYFGIMLLTPTSFRPIILTIDILERSEFQRIDELCFHHPKKEFKIELKEGTFYLLSMDGQGFRKPVHYLHQLQNLIFALTGDELIVNL